MKNSKVPGLNASLDLKGLANKMEMMMMPGNVKKAGYRVGKKMTGIDKGMDIDEKVFKNIDMDTEMIGWSRLNKQKGLSLFGDADRDKTLNVFDCDPFDMTKQAKIHDLLKLGKEKVGKFITVTQVPTEPVEPKITIIPEEKTKLTWKEKFAKARVGAQEFGAGAGKFGYAIGLLKTPEQRLEIEKRRVELAKASAAERIAMAKAMPRQLPVRRVVEERAGRMVRRVMPPPIRELTPTQKASGILGLTPYVGPMMPSYGMGGVGFRQMVPGGSPTVGVGFREMATGKEAVVQPPTPGITGVPGVPPGYSVPQPVPPSPSMVISPYSKRPVAYTRGPYRKRVIVAQPGAPQYVPQY